MSLHWPRAETMVSQVRVWKKKTTTTTTTQVELEENVQVILSKRYSLVLGNKLPLMGKETRVELLENT